MRRIEDVDIGISTRAAAEILGYGIGKINQLCRNGELTSYGTGRSRRIYLSSLEAWRTSQTFRPDQNLYTQHIKRRGKTAVNALRKIETILNQE